MRNYVRDYLVAAVHTLAWLRSHLDWLVSNAPVDAMIDDHDAADRAFWRNFNQD